MALSPDTEARVMAYLYGELSPLEVAELETTMAKDPALAAEVEGLRATVALLGDDARYGERTLLDEPPVHLYDAIVRAEALARPREIGAIAARTYDERDTKTFVQRLSTWIWGGGALVGAAAVVFVIVFGAKDEALAPEDALAPAAVEAAPDSAARGDAAFDGAVATVPAASPPPAEAVALDDETNLAKKTAKRESNVVDGIDNIGGADAPADDAPKLVGADAKPAAPAVSTKGGRYGQELEDGELDALATLYAGPSQKADKSNADKSSKDSDARDRTKSKKKLEGSSSTNDARQSAGAPPMKARMYDDDVEKEPRTPEADGEQEEQAPLREALPQDMAFEKATTVKPQTKSTANKPAPKSAEPPPPPAASLTESRAAEGKRDRAEPSAYDPAPQGGGGFGAPAKEAPDRAQASARADAKTRRPSGFGGLSPSTGSASAPPAVTTEEGEALRSRSSSKASDEKSGGKGKNAKEDELRRRTAESKLAQRDHDAELLLATAARELTAGRASDALALFEQVEADDPSGKRFGVLPVVGKMRAYVKLGRPADAYRLFARVEKAGVAAEGGVDGYLTAAEAAVALGRFSDAERIYKTVAKVPRARTRANEGLAEVARRKSAVAADEAAAAEAPAAAAPVNAE